MKKNNKYPDSTPESNSTKFKLCKDSGISAKAAAPSRAPAEKDINVHNFLCSNFIKNRTAAPDTAETTANIDFRTIGEIIIEK